MLDRRFILLIFACCCSCKTQNAELKSECLISEARAAPDSTPPKYQAIEVRTYLYLMRVGDPSVLIGPFRSSDQNSLTRRMPGGKVVHGFRHHDAAGVRHGFQARSHVDPVAINIVALMDNIAKIDADTKLQFAVLW